MLRFMIYIFLISKIIWAVSLGNNVEHQIVLRQAVRSVENYTDKSENFVECGVASSSKIVPKSCCYDSVPNAENSKLGDWPWMTALLYRNRAPTNDNPNPKSYCGGSLISKNWVVTAAHCVVQYNAYVTLQAVRLGDLILNGSVPAGATPVDVQVDKIFVHPKFSWYPTVNDIALLHLKYPVTFNEFLRPICILNEAKGLKSDTDYDNATTSLIGYGKRLEEGALSKALQDAAIHIVNTDTCAKNYNGYRAVIDDRVLCAGGNGSDSCHHISGGPLAIPLKNRWHLIGIVSYNVGCGDPNFPGVYTKVSAFSDWIANVTGIST